MRFLLIVAALFVATALGGCASSGGFGESHLLGKQLGPQSEADSRSRQAVPADLDTFAGQVVSACGAKGYIVTSFFRKHSKRNSLHLSGNAIDINLVGGRCSSTSAAKVAYKIAQAQRWGGVGSYHGAHNHLHLDRGAVCRWHNGITHACTLGRGGGRNKVAAKRPLSQRTLALAAFSD